MIYHVSPVKIDRITDDGLFGHGLFFADCECKAGAFTYELDTDDIKSCTSSHLCYEFDDTETEVTAFAKKWGIEAKAAFDIITGKESEYNHIDVCVAGDAGWEAQKIALILAMRAGYEAVELEDENGTVWLVDGYTAIKKWREI